MNPSPLTRHSILARGRYVSKGASRRRATWLCAAACLLATFGWPRPARASSENDSTPFDISLFYPACLFHGDDKTINGLSLNILHGWASTVRGLEIGGLVNVEKHLFAGLQVGGLYNLVFGDAAGIQIGGLGTEVRGEFWGLQLGGLGTSVHKGVAFQVAGFGNNTLEDVSGVQIGAVLNINGRTFPVLGMIAASGGNGPSPEIENYSGAMYTGAQVAGFMNVSTAIVGVQIAGIGNINPLEFARTSKAIEIAGVANTGSSIDGVQIAGLLNIADGVEGMQLSAFNVADDVQGLQIGAVNVTRRLQGLQIGAINIAYANALPFMVLANAGF